MNGTNYQVGGRPERTEPKTEWISKDEYDEKEHGEILLGSSKKYQIKVGERVVQKEEIHVTTFPPAGKWRKRHYVLEVERDSERTPQRAELQRVTKMRRNGRNRGKTFYGDSRVTDKVREVVKNELGDQTVVSNGN